MRLAYDDRSLGQLIKDLKDDAVLLVRQEVELAKTELRANIGQMVRDVSMVVAGAVVGLLAAMTLVATACIGLGLILAAVGVSETVASWLAPLIIGITLVVIALVLIQVGKQKLDRHSLSPDLTRETMRENKEWIRDKLR